MDGWTAPKILDLVPVQLDGAEAGRRLGPALSHAAAPSAAAAGIEGFRAGIARAG